VLSLLAQGYQDNQVARQVGISDSSVRRHIAAIEKRLDAKTRFEAGVTAHRLGWID
jgi:DNA-binding NarL/FixJ family response regulator